MSRQLRTFKSAKSSRTSYLQFQISIVYVPAILQRKKLEGNPQSATDARSLSREFFEGSIEVACGASFRSLVLCEKAVARRR